MITIRNDASQSAPLILTFDELITNVIEFDGDGISVAA